MTLAAGDLTTPQNVATWLANPPALPNTLLTQLVTRMSNMIYSKLSRAKFYSQTITRVFDGVGNYQLVLPDYPVTSVVQVQMGAANIPPTPLPTLALNNSISYPNSFGYGYRFVPWSGNLPGENAVLEFVNGFFWPGVQNIKVTYVAGYLIQNEAWIVPATPYEIIVNQPSGTWSADNGVYYSVNGVAGGKLTPVAASPMTGQYIPPPDANPGLYTFSMGDAAANLLINYSYIPSDVEEACIQMVAERYSYRNRVGEISKSLGGQETMRWMRGGRGPGALAGLPPEVVALLEPYITVVPPALGAPV